MGVFNPPEHQARIYSISNRVGLMLGLAPYEAPTFTLPSKSRPDVEYPMVVTPEGIAVHEGEGCEAEFFYQDAMKCHHSKEGSSRMTQLTTYQAPSSPVEIRFNDEQMKVITSTIAKGATPEELQLFVATCMRTGLDPFIKQIYAVKRWDSKEKREVMAIQVGIDGLRLIAERTGKYGGQDPIEWLDADGVWSEVWTGNGEHPIAARTAVYRKDWSHKAPAVCRWDSYAQYFGSERKLSPMWDKMPDVMLGKCAESLALRRAFPAEMSGVAAAIDADYDSATDVELQQEPTWTPAPDAIEGSMVQAPPRPAPAPPTPAPAPPEPQDSACDHKDSYYNEDTTMLTCRTCGLVLEEPPESTPKQRSMV